MNTLDYVTPKARVAGPGPARVMVAVAWACWLVPLPCWVIAMVGYRAMRAEFFGELGLISLFGGTMAALAGLVLAVLTYKFSERLPPGIRGSLRSRAKTAVLGIALNFPIALFCIHIATS